MIYIVRAFEIRDVLTTNKGKQLCKTNTPFFMRYPLHTNIKIHVKQRSCLTNTLHIVLLSQNCRIQAVISKGGYIIVYECNNIICLIRNISRVIFVCLFGCYCLFVCLNAIFNTDHNVSDRSVNLT